LILAVLLGLVAVLAVGRLLSKQKKAEEAVSSVVAAARDLEVGVQLSGDAVMEKMVPVTSRPVNAVAWANHEMIIGQRVLRPVAQGDYVMLTDIGFSRSLASVVGEGEWAVSFRPGGAVVRLIQPGDEVAVIGTYTVRERPNPLAGSEPATTDQGQVVTAVLFPRVRVLDVTGSAPGREDGDPGEILVALPPAEAQFLVRAMREVELTVALRRPGDDSALSRADAGMISKKTFEELLTGLEPVILPNTPGGK